MNTDRRRGESPSSVVFCGGLVRRFLAASILPATVSQDSPGRDTAPGAAWEPSRKCARPGGFSRLPPGFVCRESCASSALRGGVCAASVRLWDGVSLGFPLGFLACSSPVPPPGLSFPPVSDHSDLGLFVAALRAGQRPHCGGCSGSARSRHGWGFLVVRSLFDC